MIRSLLIVVTLGLITGCGTQQLSEFDQVCQILSVRPHVAKELREFQDNRGADNRARFELLRTFCIRRQTAAPREQRPELYDPIIDTNSVLTLLGQPDEYTSDGSWIYFFSPESTWHLELSFREGKLFYTSYRQLMSADEMFED